MRSVGGFTFLLAWGLAGGSTAADPAAPAAVPVLRVVRTISLGGDVPRDLALSRDGATLLVACATEAGMNGKVKVLAAATGKAIVRDIAVGGPTGAVAISPAGRWAFVTGAGDGTKLMRLHLVKGDTAGETTLGAGAGALAFSDDGKFVYVGVEALPRVDILETQWNQTQGTIAGLPRGPRRAALVPGGRFLYLLLPGGKLAKADLVAAAVEKVLPVDGGDVVAAPDGAHVYVNAGEWDTAVKEVATADDGVVRVIDTELVPGALAPDPLGRWLWVALPRNGRAGLLDLAAGKLVATVKTGPRPARIVAAPDGKTAYCANAGDSTISVLEVTVPDPVPAADPATTAGVSSRAGAGGDPGTVSAGAPGTVAVAAPSATALAVAVTDFESQGVAGSVASIVTEWLRDEMLKAGAYRLLERRRMDAILSEQSLQQTGCTDQDCAVKLGKLLNVSRMLVGSLGKFEEAYIIVARLVDVENGQVVWSGTAKGKTGDDVEAAVRRLARELSAAGK